MYALTVMFKDYPGQIYAAHKALIPGRHCSWDEAGLKVLGAFLGVGAVLIVGALKGRQEGKA